jgi:hypothetical protein
MNFLQNQQTSDQNKKPKMDSDYDVFAKYRPQIDENIDVNENTENDENDVSDEYDPYRNYRPVESEVEQTKNQKKQKEKRLSPKEIEKEVYQQGIKETLIGAAGTYGDLLQLVGLGGQSEKEEDKNYAEFETLEKMEQPGYKPSFSDIDSLSEDNTLPTSPRLPNSKGLREFNDLIGGPGKPKSFEGKVAARTGRLYGSGIAFGDINPGPPTIAGIAGQLAEEAGAGELGQAGAEIAALFASGGFGSGIAASTKQAVKAKINQLRSLNYTEKEIATSISAGEKYAKIASKQASKGSKSESLIENIGKKSENLVEDILGSSISGYEKGPQHIHEMASKVYGEVAKDGSKLILQDTKPFINSAEEAIKEISKNLGVKPELKPIIKRLKEAISSAKKNPTAENMMKFYQELGAMGGWTNRADKDRILTIARNGIKDTFGNNGKEGKEFLKKFEAANEGVKKAYQAEDVYNLLKPSKTQDGLNFSTLSKVFDKKDNVDLLTKTIGKTQTRNLQLIAKTGAEVKNFDKEPIMLWILLLNDHFIKQFCKITQFHLLYCMCIQHNFKCQTFFNIISQADYFINL